MRPGRGWIAGALALLLVGLVANVALAADDPPQKRSDQAIKDGLQMCEMGDHQAGLDSIEKGILILKAANLPIPGPPESLPEYKKCLGIWARRLGMACERRGGRADIETIANLLNQVGKIQNPVDPATRTPIPDILANALGNCVIRYAMYLSSSAKQDPAGALGPVNDLIKVEYYLENITSKQGAAAAEMARQALWQGKVDAVKAGLDHGLALCKKKKKDEGKLRFDRYLLYLDMIGYDDPAFKRRKIKEKEKRCK